MLVPVCYRPSVAESTEAQDRTVMETKSATIHRKMPVPARQLPITGSAHNAGMVGEDLGAAALATPQTAAERLGAARLNVSDGAPMRRRHRRAMGR